MDQVNPTPEPFGQASRVMAAVVRVLAVLADEDSVTAGVACTDAYMLLRSGFDFGKTPYQVSEEVAREYLR